MSTGASWTLSLLTHPPHEEKRRILLPTPRVALIKPPHLRENSARRPWYVDDRWCRLAASQRPNKEGNREGEKVVEEKATIDAKLELWACRRLNPREPWVATADRPTWPCIFQVDFSLCVDQWQA